MYGFSGSGDWVRTRDIENARLFLAEREMRAADYRKREQSAQDFGRYMWRRVRESWRTPA